MMYVLIIAYDFQRILVMYEYRENYFVPETNVFYISLELMSCSLL